MSTFSPKHINDTIASFDKILSRRPTSKENIPAYCDLTVIRKVSKTKFPVYLASSKVDKQHYAMKIFPYVADKCHDYFNNEIRFAFLKHPNIINTIHSERHRETVQKGEINKVSYILMEYAPHGDFFDFISKFRNYIDEKLARTYFKQLIDGIEYLHENGIAHLDLKPENLLIGADFNLKIIDFDLSYISGDAHILSNGTKYYRAPEFFKPGSSDKGAKLPFAADIYSAGIILFIMKSGGMYPHSENDVLDGINFNDLLCKDNSKFWKYHCQLQEKKSSFFDSCFKELFTHMVKLNPEKRWSIRQVKQSKWYNGPVYTPQELHDIMKKLLDYKP